MAAKFFLSKELIKFATLVVFALVSLAAGIIKFYSYFYFLFSVFTATLLISFLVRFLSGKGIEIKRTFIDRVYEEQELAVELTVENTGFLPQVLVTVEDLFDRDHFRAVPEIFFIPIIGPKKVKKLTYRLECLKRGVYQIGPAKIRHFDPFGIFPAKKLIHKISKILVYPAAYDLDSFRFKGGGLSPRIGLETVPRTGSALEFYNTREYRPGDSLRLIHWKSSARAGKLIVKEFEKSVATDVTIFLELNKNQEVGQGRESNIEYAIKIAATLAKYIIGRFNLIQIIASSKYLNFRVAPGSGWEHFYDILTQLATLQPVGEKKFSDLILENYEFLNSKSLVILVFSKLASVAATRSVLPVLQTKNIQVAAVVIDDRTFDPAQKSKMDLDGNLPREIFDLINAGASAYYVRQGRNLPDQLSKVYQ